MAAPPAAVVVVQVVAEALPVAVPVPAVVDLAHLAVLALAQVPARRAHRVQRPRLALLLSLLAKAAAHLPVPAVAQAALPDLVVLVVAPAAVLLQLLLSRQSFSAAMARNTPPPRATSEPVRKSR